MQTFLMNLIQCAEQDTPQAIAVNILIVHNLWTCRRQRRHHKNLRNINKQNIMQCHAPTAYKDKQSVHRNEFHFVVVCFAVRGKQTRPE